MNSNNSHIRILIIEDDEDDFHLTSQYIKAIPESKHWKIDWCYKYDDAIDHICNKNYDLYFVDYFLGAKTGLDLLREKSIKNCHEPIILLTGKGNQEIDLEAMISGAMDYLVKSELNTEKLERTIRYALEKAQTLKALRINEEKYRNIFEQSKDAIFVLDAGLKFTSVNHTTIQLLEYTLEEIIQLSVTDLMANELHALELIESFHKKGEINDVEIELVCKSGKEKICLFSASVITDSSENSFIQGLLHDITQLRTSEKSSLMIEKLAVAARLVQTLAHEIRNPLTNITLSYEQLQKSDHYEAQEPYFDIIYRNSNRINQILSQLIYSSQPTDVILYPNFVQAVLDDAIASASDRIVLKNIRLQVKYPNESIVVMADKSQLSLAFLNIITNSIEAMEEKEGRLIISVQTHENNCEIRITDNGCGISEENQKRLFEPYFTNKRNGVGLGLSATLNILQSHRSKIDVISIPGTGTTFCVTIPIKNKILQKVS
jgi:PAS domain S-box-containing protein